WRRLRAFVLFAARSVLEFNRTRDCDVVLATSTPLTAVIPGIVSKVLWRKRLIFEVRDVWPDAAIEIGELRNPVAVALAMGLEALGYHYADQIVPLSSGMRDRIRRKGVRSRKLTVIPNGCDLERFS